MSNSGLMGLAQIREERTFKHNETIYKRVMVKEGRPQWFVRRFNGDAQYGVWEEIRTGRASEMENIFLAWKLRTKLNLVEAPTP